MNLIQQLEQEEIARLGKTIPQFAPGDTVIVNVNVVEGERKRVQAFEGVVIAKRNGGLNSSFIVRKVSSGEGVERTFQMYSPIIASIEVKRDEPPKAPQQQRQQPEYRWYRWSGRPVLGGEERLFSLHPARRAPGSRAKGRQG